MQAMKLSDIVKGFQELQKTYGDVNVYMHDNYSDSATRYLVGFYIGKDAVVNECLNGIVISPKYEGIT